MNELDITIRQMDSRALSRLMKTLARLEIAVLKCPEAGLLMVSATDPFSVDFHLGEALVTEALVEYEGVQGYGIVLGDQPERALAAAAVDAIARAGSPELGRIAKLLEPERKKIAEARKLEEALVESTRVKFETMVKG